MRIRFLAAMMVMAGCLRTEPALGGDAAQAPASVIGQTRVFSARGVIEELPLNLRTVVIKHEAISNYMAAMTMPFNVRDPHILAGLHPGDEVSFRLNVAADESWVTDIHKTGVAAVEPPRAAAIPVVSPPPGSFMDYALTNELGEKVTLNDFHGQALAITFFYTRCPLPDFCPRLSRNFQGAAQKLRALPGGPTNWHFLSISFDTEFDSPAMLQAYANSYDYRPNEWSFLTGSPAVIAELARLSGVTYTPNSGGFQHNFRTLIVDAAGHLQTTFPMGGDLSSDIVAQILQAAAVTNQPALSIQSH